MRKVRQRSRLGWSSAAAALIGVLVACSSSSDDAGPNPEGSCSQLASRCHHYAATSPLANECHELGHGGDDSKCVMKLDACLAECPPNDASKPDAPDAPDGSTSDAMADPMCASYCQCLTDACSSVTGYPFMAQGSCLSACAAMTAPERACWPTWCEQARAGGASKGHLCQHAWGEFDLDECP